MAVDDNAGDENVSLLTSLMDDLGLHIDNDDTVSPSSSQFYTPTGNTFVPSAFSHEGTIIPGEAGVAAEARPRPDPPTLEGEEEEDEEEDEEEEGDKDEENEKHEGDETEEAEEDDVKSGAEEGGMMEGAEEGGVMEEANEDAVDVDAEGEEDGVAEESVVHMRRIVTRQVIAKFKAMAAQRRESGQPDPVGDTWENHLLREDGYYSQEDLRPSKDEESVYCSDEESDYCSDEESDY